MMTRRRKKSLRSGNARQANVRMPLGSLVPRLLVRRLFLAKGPIKSEGAFAPVGASRNARLSSGYSSGVVHCVVVPHFQMPFVHGVHVHPTAMRA
jgi:hypothetical protein